MKRTREQLELMEHQQLLGDAVDLAILLDERDETIATLRALLREAAPKCGMQTCVEIATWRDEDMLFCERHREIHADILDQAAPLDLGRRIQAALEDHNE